MKKLILLITIFSFYNAVAMDPQDQHGNTPLHNAVIAWQKSNTNAQEKAKEYAQLNDQYKQVQREITAEQAKNRTHNNALVVLDAKCQTLLQKAKMVKAEYAQYKKQTDSYKKTAIELIQNGSSIIISNSDNKTVAQLCPGLIYEFVYEPLWKAVAAGDILTVEKYLRLGADPEFTNADERNALVLSIDCNKPEVAKKLLFSGAKLTTKFKFAGRGAINPLHLAANRATYHMVETLLYSPQAGPSPCSNTHRLKKTPQEMFTFLCCMNRKKDTESLEIPGEVLHHISTFLVPDAKELIDEVSLEQLPHYLSLKVHGKTVLNKTAVINALTQRHMELIGKALFTKSDINIGNVIAVPPYQFLRLASINDIHLRTDAQDVQKALDPTKVEQHRAAITANYIKLLE